MKKISLILVLAICLSSCGKSEKDVDGVIESGDLSEIREMKATLSSEQSRLSEEIAKLDAAIQELDVDQQIPLVNTIKIQDSVFNHYIELPGDVETDQNIIIYPEFSGVLLEVLVEEGDQVNRGQVLARIDDGGLRSQLAQLETQAALAKTTFERQERLWNQKIGSEIQYLESKTNYEAIQNSVDQLRSQLAKTVVRAPFGGVIDEIFTDQGQVVAPGQSQLFRLLNLSDMYITAAVPESYLTQINKGTQVLVEIPAAGTQFESQVEQVGNFINPNNRTFEIRVAVPESNQQVKPYLIATVKLNDYSAEAAISIPENVIQRTATGEDIVYVVEPENDSIGIARRKIVETGSNYGENMEILEGLHPEDILIVEGAKNVQEGERVNYKNN